MKRKNILLLLIIFIILTGFAIYPLFSDRIPSMQKKEINSDLPLQLFTSETTDSVTITKNTDAVVLKKDANSWNIASYSAATKQVDSLFSAMKDSTIEHIVSKNLQNQNEYELASDSGTFITLDSGNKQYSFIVGKEGPEPGSFYAKKNGSLNVYLLKGPLREIASAKSIDWRIKIVTRVSKETVATVVVENENPFTLSIKDTGKWEISVGEKKKELEDPDVSTGFSYTSPLEGHDFLNGDELKEFQSAKKFTINFSDKTKQSVGTLSILKKDADYWIKGDKNDDVMKVYGYKLDGLFKLHDKLQ